MPDLPTFRTSRTKTGTRAIPKEAPLSVGAADIGAGAVGRGLAAAGKGIGDVGEALFGIEQDKQRIRDNAALSVGGADLNKFGADKFEEYTRKQYTTIEQFKEDRTKFSNDYDAEVKRLAAKMSSRAAQRFKNFALRHKQTTTNGMNRIWWPKEIAFGQSNSVRAVSERYRAMVSAGAPLDQMTNDEVVKEIGEGNRDYWRKGQFEKERDRALISVLRQNGRFDDAVKLAKTTKAFKTEKERESSIRNTENARKASQLYDDKQLKRLQEETAIKYSGLVAQVETTAEAVSLMTDIDRDIASEILDRKVGEGYKRQLIKGKEVPTAWDVYDKLALDIEAVRDGQKDFLEVFNEIQAHRGKDIHDDQIKSLTNDVLSARDKDSPLNRPTAKRGFTALEEIKDMRIALMKEGDAADTELRGELLLHFGLKNDFEQWLLEKPRTDDEIEKKVKSLTEPVREKITLNWFERFMLLKRVRFGFIPSETSLLVEKKIKALKSEGVWKTLTTQEKETVQRAFEEGKTVQDVLDLVE